jgi:hypothetical protein
MQHMPPGTQLEAIPRSNEPWNTFIESSEETHTPVYTMEQGVNQEIKLISKNNLSDGPQTAQDNSHTNYGMKRVICRRLSL